LYKLINEDMIWQELLRNKYLKNKTWWNSTEAGRFTLLVRPYEGQRSISWILHF
jgi:hypothetical protein